MIPVTPNMQVASVPSCSEVQNARAGSSHSASGHRNLFSSYHHTEDFCHSLDVNSVHPHPVYSSHTIKPLPFEPFMYDPCYPFRASTSQSRSNGKRLTTSVRGSSTTSTHVPSYTHQAMQDFSYSSDANNDHSDLLASVQVVPKTSGQGYDVFRSRISAQRADDITTDSGFSQDLEVKSISSLQRPNRCFDSRDCFTESLVSDGTRFSRNIANPKLREKQKNKLEEATNKMDFFRSSDFAQPTNSGKAGSTQNSRRLPSSATASKRLLLNNTNIRQNDIMAMANNEIFTSKSVVVFDSGQQQQTGQKGSGLSLRRSMASTFSTDSKLDSKSSANVAKNVSSTSNKEGTFSSTLTLKEPESKTPRRKLGASARSDSRDFECSCSLYHSHHIQGTPINNFFTEVKEKRYERIMASTKIVEEGTSDNVDDPRNVFWVPALSFHPYVHGNPKVDFGSLWPKQKELGEHLQNPGIQQQVMRGDAVLALCTLAVTCGPIHLLQCLIDLGLIRVDQQTDCGSGLLHLAVLARNAKSVKYLMAAKVSPKIRDRQGLTADQVCYSSHIRKQLLPRYIQSRDMTKEKILLKPSLQDKDTIFKLATSPQHFADIQKKLQSLDFNVNTECDNNGDFLLHIASRSGLSQLPLLMALVKIQGADIELCNVNGMTSLMMAAADGNCVLCDVLICLFGADPNKTNSSSGKSALHYASEGNHRKTVECLIRRGADVNLEDFDGFRPDDIPGYCSETDDCCEVILFHRNRRLDMLSDIVKKGQVAASQLLPSDLCVVDAERHTLLMMAAIYNRSDTIETLLSVSRATVNAQHSRTGMTALAIAAQMGNSSSVETLLRYNANPAIADMKGFLPLHHAVLNNHELTVETLLEFFPHTYVGLFQARRLCKKTSIHSLLRQAWERRQEEIVTPKLLGCALNGDAEELYLLLDEGDNINPKSGTGNWPLYLAVENGHLEVLKLIVERGGDFLKRHPTTGSTALHLAAKMGHESIVSFLLQYCHRNKKSIIMPTSTSMLFSNFLSSSLKFSNQQPSQVPSESSKCTDRHGEGKKLLYINAVDGDNKTALQVAAEKGFSRIVEMLLQQGASTAILDSKGNLVLCSQYEGVRIMIETHRYQHTKEIFGCIEDKSRHNRKGLSLLQSIWLPKFDHNLRNKEGSTPLMVASFHGHIPMIKFMLHSAVYKTLDEMDEENDHDSDTDSGVLDPSSESPKFKDEFNMSQSIDFGVVHDVKPRVAVSHTQDNQSQFLTNSTDLFNQRILDRIIRDANSPKGMTIYHSGMTSHICAVNLVDGTTCLHQAVLGSDSHQVLSLLLEADAGPLNIQDDKGETALHLACRLNRKKCVEFLLAQRGIDLNVRTLNGLLPEELCTQKSVQKMVEKARKFCSVNVPSNDEHSPVNASPALSGRSASIIASTINFDKLHTRYEEMKRDKNSPPTNGIETYNLEFSS